MQPHPPTVSLREVRDDDLDALFAHQADAEAAAMADFPSRDRAAFLEHMARITADPEARYRVIEADGQVVGNIGSFYAHGGREVGYWIDRAHWGRGIASRALELLVARGAICPLGGGRAPQRRIPAGAGEGRLRARRRRRRRIPAVPPRRLTPAQQHLAVDQQDETHGRSLRAPRPPASRTSTRRRCPAAWRPHAPRPW